MAIGLAVAFATAPAVSAAASPRATVDPSGTSRPEAGMLRISVAPEIVDASLISGWISERNQRVEEQVPTFEGHEQWIAVKITGTTYDYRITVVPMRDGDAVGELAPPAVCACASDKLLVLVDDQIARAIEQLQAAPLEAELVMPPLTPDDVAPTNPEPQPPPPPPPTPRRRLSGMGIAGALLTGLGGSAVAGGAVMMALDSRAMPQSTGGGRNWQIPGTIGLATGGAVLAAGVSLLVADAVRCRKPDGPRRCRHRPEGLEVAPSFEAGAGGVIVVGRF